jgi:hypothetical protein
MKKIVIFIGLIISVSGIFAQNTIDEWKIAILKIENSDTLYLMNLPTVTIATRAPRHIRKQIKKYNRLVRYVKKVYPYAKLAANKMKEYEQVILSAENEADKRKKMKEAELALKNQFQDDIQKLTFKQGVILIKLIDRETGNSSYEIIKELRGGLSAFVWQTVAKIFGYSLKVKYDPYGEDKEIEGIVQRIERGEI